MWRIVARIVLSLGISALLFFLWAAINLIDVFEIAARKTEDRMRLIEQAIHGYSFDHGRYPTVEEGLKSLMHDPKDVPPEMKIVSNDYWENPFQYRRDLEGIPFGIYSTGEDGISRTRGEDEDDLNTWRTNGGQSYYEAKLMRQARLVAIAIWLGLAAVVHQALGWKWMA